MAEAAEPTPEQTPEQTPELLCISTYEKGQAFLREAAQLGCSVTLLTVDKLAHADWPRDVLRDVQTMPEGLLPHQVLPHAARLMQHRDFRRIVPLDEFDLETAALLREHFRIPGMGLTRTHNFRDKLAMREAAASAGVAVPAFSGVANHDRLWQFLQSTEGPWLLKPRWSASAIGIQRLERPDDVWPHLERLGDQASDHLVECFLPGEVYHVEGVTWNGELLFESAQKYGHPPMQTMHQGGVFTTRTLPRESEEVAALATIHAATLRALGMRNGVTHSEFIRAERDGRFYFLETAARVGGAYIAELVEAATGVNPWIEWARIEVALLRGEAYHLPPLRSDYAGSVICLARQETPDTSAFDAPEVTLRLHKFHHAGLVLRSPSADRIQSLVEEYAGRFLSDFCARLDAPDKPTS